MCVIGCKKGVIVQHIYIMWQSGAIIEVVQYVWKIH